MKVDQIINTDFAMAFNKILTCEKLPRQQVSILKSIALPIMSAQRRYQIQHNKLINLHGERDADGRIIEVALGNGTSRFKIRAESEEAFREAIDALRDEDIVLPKAKLSFNIIQDFVKMTPLDEIMLAEILYDEDAGVSGACQGNPESVPPMQ